MSWRRFIRLLMGLLVVLLLVLVGVYLWLVPQRGAGIVSAKGTAEDTEWRFLFAIYGPGTGKAQWFLRPQGVASDGRRLYVADTDNHRICVFDDRGHFLRQVGTYGIRIARGAANPQWKPGELAWPTDCAAAADGTIWVADTVNRAVQRFDPDGRATLVFPRTGRPGDYAPGKSGHASLLERPLSVTVAENRLYVADGFRVGRYSMDGKPEGYFGKQKGSPAAGAILQAWGMVVDERGSVAVADALNHRVQAFGSTGKLLWTTATPPTKSGTAPDVNPEELFALPRGMDRDAAGHIYVADALRAKVVILAANGSKLAEMGELGRNQAQLFLPNDVALTRAGTIFVADKGNNRIQAFRLNVRLPE